MSNINQVDVVPTERDDDDYDQERYDNEVADDLFYTFLGADDDMRNGEDYE